MPGKVRRLAKKREVGRSHSAARNVAPVSSRGVLAPPHTFSTARKHGAIFDRQRLGGRERKLDVIRRNDNDPAKRFPSGNNR